MEHSLGLLGWLGGVALFMAVMAGTPGPNNVLLAASGVQFGFRRTAPLITGIALGMLSQLLLVSAGLGSTLQQLPVVGTMLKIAGSLYVAWLALKLWRGPSVASSDDVARPISVVQGAGLQYLNPKSWLAILTLTSTSLANRTSTTWWELILAAATFTVVVTVASSVWAVFGSALRHVLKSPAAVRMTGRIFAVCALASIALFWV